MLWFGKYYLHKCKLLIRYMSHSTMHSYNSSVNQIVFSAAEPSHQVGRPRMSGRIRMAALPPLDATCIEDLPHVGSVSITILKQALTNKDLDGSLGCVILLAIDTQCSH